ncbi:protoporphyrinogen oxidase [Aciduricibacillus chroicocephali]|uniref:Coproporphyrinogen III oxidase n=1 Tax=Aciduricibacillus chroicocephali TaxID=3054939 RepID=A0ABY9KYP4_9BACI|nr:protoporphyrinogen oxidase [Bacillaceae bacterium 44XB]
MNRKIAIIGGGITGLSAAYSLKKKIEEKGLPIDIALFEGSNRLGGKIETMHHGDFVIERGADSFLARKRPAVDLVKSLGLEEELVRNGTGQSYVLSGGKLHKIPKGSYRGIPTRLGPYFNSSLFSAKGKLRGSMDLVLPKSKHEGDQSLGAFFRHRFGDEFVERLIEPLLAGIYSGNIDEMSLMATFPQFHELEQRHGSLVKGLQATMPEINTKKQKNPKAKEGAFLSLRNGLGTMITALEKELGAIIFKDESIDHIEKKENRFNLLLGSGEVFKADRVVIATEHEAVPKMLSQYDFLKVLNEIPSTSTANVALAFDKTAIRKDIDGTGFVVARKSKTRITACTWTHKKWPTTTPEGKALVRCYVGKPDDQEVVNLSDEELTEIVLKDLNKTMKIKKDPEFAVITRWREARPQYTVGHVERMNKIQAGLEANLPGVFLAGSSYAGVGIPDCIEQGEKAASNALIHLENELY